MLGPGLPPRDATALRWIPHFAGDIGDDPRTDLASVGVDEGNDRRLVGLALLAANALVRVAELQLAPDPRLVGNLANEASGRTLAARGARTAPRFGLRRIRWPFACVADQARRRLGAPRLHGVARMSLT
jgi:hypothetical protein